MEILLLNDSFPPEIDGVANTVVNYATIIEKKFGHAIVGTPEFPGYTDDFPFEVMRYPSLDTTKLFGYRAGLPLNLTFTAQLASKPIDLIHSHCPISSNILAHLVRETIHRPIIMTYHTKFDVDIQKAIKAELIQEIAINALVSNISFVDEVWCVSKGAAENLKSLGYKGDCVIMPNGVDFDRGAASPEETDKILEEYHLGKDVPTFLFVGRLMWYKGIRIILDALKVLKDLGKPFRMLFVGDGTDKTEIRTYIDVLQLSEECIFAGSVTDRKKLKAIYSACDLFLFPSTFDTNGLVVREAAASGIASVLIAGSSAAEDVTDGQNGFLIPENAEDMAELLVRIGSKKEYLRKIGTNAMNELYMSWEESVGRAVERYRYVSEKYTYHKPELILDTAGENFYGFLGDVANGIEKLHTMHQSAVESIVNLRMKNLTALKDLKGKLKR